MANFINKPKILYLMAGHPSIFGGGKRVFLQIMTHLDNKTFQFYSCCALNQEQEETLSKKGGIITHIDIQHGGIFMPLIKLVKLLKEEKIDVIHSQGSRADFYSRIAAKLAGHRIKVVNTIAVLVEGYDVGPLKKLLYMAFDRLSEGYVDRFIVVSDVLVKAMIHDHCVARNKVIKIYNGIETDIYQPENQSVNRHRIREEFRVADEGILIGGIGRLVWPKGFEYFIQAIPDVIQASPQSRFLLVGDGALRRDLETLTRSLNLQNHLLFAGQRTDIRDILAALDIVIIPSLQEGFPIITLEAMAMAKPIVATSIDGITEQITNGVEGLLVPPKDPSALAKAIIKVINDKELAMTMGLAARKKVERDFSVEKMISETEKVYLSLLRTD